MAVDTRRSRVPARRPRTKGRRRRRYFHGGTISMLFIATLLAVITAFVATIVYADIDAGRPLAAPPTTVAANSATTRPPPTAPPSTSTTTTILTADDLAKKINASTLAVHTYDTQGQPVDGTALVVGSFGGQTLLLTSYSLVRAATVSPPPPLTVGSNQQATLWTWQESRDLALLVVNGSIVSLPWASAPPNAGDKIYVAGAGEKLAVGIVTSVTANGIAHNVFMDPMRQGGPMVNEKGEVLGLASIAYDPDAKGSDSVFVAIPIRLACERVLQCGSGNTAPGVTPTSTPLSVPTTTAGSATTKPATTTTKPATTTTTVKATTTTKKP